MTTNALRDKVIELILMNMENANLFANAKSLQEKTDEELAMLLNATVWKLKSNAIQSFPMYPNPTMVDTYTNPPLTTSPIPTITWFGDYSSCTSGI